MAFNPCPQHIPGGQKAQTERIRPDSRDIVT